MKTLKTTRLKEGEIYYWFPCIGDSMTDNSSRSIPTGSLALGRQININHHYAFSNLMHTPVIIEGIMPSGVKFRVLKTITFLDFAFHEEGAIRLTSFNPTFRDQWIPIAAVKKVSLVEQVKVKGRKTRFLNS